MRRTQPLKDRVKVVALFEPGEADAKRVVELNRLHPLIDEIFKRIQVNDMMRNGKNGPVRGNRFGGNCQILGNVSADLRFPQFVAVAPGQPPQVFASQADFDGYKFYDLWIGNRPKLYLPGEFFYKSNGPIVAADPQSLDASRPIKPIAQLFSFNKKNYQLAQWPNYFTLIIN